jgi:hypothetical protein
LAFQARKERVTENMEEEKGLAQSRFKKASKLLVEGIDNDADSHQVKHLVEERSEPLKGNDVETSRKALKNALKSGDQVEIMAAMWAAMQNGRIKDVMRDLVKESGETVKVRDKDGNLVDTGELTEEAKFLQSFGFNPEIKNEDPEAYMKLTDKMLGRGYKQDMFLAKIVTQWAKENGKHEWLYHRTPDASGEGFQSSAVAMHHEDIPEKNQIKEFIATSVGRYQAVDIDKAIAAKKGFNLANQDGIDKFEDYKSKNPEYKLELEEQIKDRANKEIDKMNRREWEILDWTIKKDRNEIIEERLREGFLHQTEDGKDLNFHTKVMRDAMLTRADARAQFGAKVKNLADAFHIKGVDAETGALLIDEKYWDEYVNSTTYIDTDGQRKQYEHLKPIFNAISGVLTGNPRIDRNGNNGAFVVAVDSAGRSAGKAAIFTAGGEAKSLVNFGTGETGEGGPGQVLISPEIVEKFKQAGVQTNMVAAGSKTNMEERQIRTSKRDDSNKSDEKTEREPGVDVGFGAGR